MKLYYTFLGSTSIHFGWLTLVILVPINYFTAWHYQYKFELYQKKGQEKEANILDKLEGTGNFYSLKVNYVVNGKSLTNEATVNSKVFKKVRKNEKVKILLLTQKFKKPILKLSTKPENFMTLEKYESIYFLLVVSLWLFIIGLFLLRLAT